MLCTFWGPFWGQKLLQTATKNETSFGTLSLRLSEVGEMRFWELNESGEKATGAGIILDKRKGGIYMHVNAHTCLMTAKLHAEVWLNCHHAHIGAA